MMDTNKNLPVVFSSDPAAIAAAESAKARIQSAYIMSIQRPRNEDNSRHEILEACKRPEFAERVEYNKPVSGHKIKGPSIRFAELALRCWRNIMTNTETIFEDDKIRRVRVTVLDLETNASFSKEIQIGKTVERKNKTSREVLAERINSTGEIVYIVTATEDELQNKEAALISKAIRNEGLRIIPSDIIDEAIETARQTLSNRYSEDPKAGKKKVLDSFSTIFIKPSEIERYLKHSLDTVSPAELQDLRGIFSAIRDGEATWQDYINTKEPEEQSGPVKLDQLINTTSKSPDITDEKRDNPPAQKTPRDNQRRPHKRNTLPPDKDNQKTESREQPDTDQEEGSVPSPRVQLAIKYAERLDASKTRDEIQIIFNEIEKDLQGGRLEETDCKDLKRMGENVKKELK